MMVLTTTIIIMITWPSTPKWRSISQLTKIWSKGKTWFWTPWQGNGDFIPTPELGSFITTLALHFSRYITPKASWGFQFWNQCSLWSWYSCLFFASRRHKVEEIKWIDTGNYVSILLIDNKNNSCFPFWKQSQSYSTNVTANRVAICAGCNFQNRTKKITWWKDVLFETKKEFCKPLRNVFLTKKKNCCVIIDRYVFLLLSLLKQISFQITFWNARVR